MTSDDVMTSVQCESVSYSGSIARGTASAHRCCTRPAKWVVTIKRMGRRIEESRCAWHRDEGSNARPRRSTEVVA